MPSVPIVLDQRHKCADYLRMATHNNAAARTSPRLLRMVEAAEWLACSRRYLDELVRKGRLRAVRLDPKSPKTARVSTSDLDAFMSGLPAHQVGAA